MKIILPPAALEHARAEYPRESCGVLVNGAYFPCSNMAKTPTEHFIICESDYRQALEAGEVQAIIHSHPDESAAPSLADLSACEETALPWAIIEVREGVAGVVSWTEPSGYKAPILGRPFVHGVHDCVSILLDFYAREMGQAFTNPEREDEWWNKGENLYLDNLPVYGFEQLPDGTELQRGDIILMQIKSKVPNHAGIYIPGGILESEPSGYPVPCCILHHMHGQLSRRDVYGGFWMEKTVGVWRLKK